MEQLKKTVIFKKLMNISVNSFFLAYQQQLFEKLHGEAS
jgi:hypothetical protein